jgi:exosortase/archaeosortase family protein
VIVAYNYSLLSLLQDAGLETPLAYVALVPAIALALAALRSRPPAHEPSIHDRQVDYIVGLPLVSVALVINLTLPARLSAMFWVWRIDLVTLPIFVAGAVAIIFGTRVLWRQKLAIGYLILAWPLPYSALLLRELNAFTSLTLAGIHGALHLVPIAKQIPSADGSIFEVVHHGHAFPVSVVSACSGVNGMVGFLLVGSAFGAIVSGPRLRKVLWLSAGLALIWVLNLARILGIFWAGRLWGQHFALDILHPVAGLVAFTGGVLVMMLLIRPLGMEISFGEDARNAPEVTSSGSVAPAHLEEIGPGAGASVLPPPLPGASLQRRAVALAVPRIYLAVALVAAAAVTLGVTNTGLRAYNLVADAAGEPRLYPFADAPIVPAGWQARASAVYDWAKPLFGADSTWTRYQVAPASAALAGSTPFTADVIDTSDLGSFSAYGVEACYQFHGYHLERVSQVDVGGGVTGQSIAYTTTEGSAWSIVYWIVPVRSGNATRYERVVLYVLDSAPTPQLASVSSTDGGLPPRIAATGSVLDRNRAVLVAFARQMIQAQSFVATSLAEPRSGSALPSRHR